MFKDNEMHLRMDSKKITSKTYLIIDSSDYQSMINTAISRVRRQTSHDS